MRKTALVVLFVLVTMVGMSAGCGTNEEIKADVVGCLMRMDRVGMGAIGSELEEIDEQLSATEEKLLKLEVVVSHALEWIEYRKGGEYEVGTWITRVPTEALAPFKNDQYQVTVLDLTVIGGGTSNPQFSAKL